MNEKELLEAVKPEIKISCSKCNAVLAYYEGDNFFMAVIMGQNKQPFTCGSCHVASKK